MLSRPSPGVKPTLTTLSEINHAEIRESDRRNNRESEQSGLLLPTRNLRPPKFNLHCRRAGGSAPTPGITGTFKGVTDSAGISGGATGATAAFGATTGGAGGTNAFRPTGAAARRTHSTVSDKLLRATYHPSPNTTTSDTHKHQRTLMPFKLSPNRRGTPARCRKTSGAQKLQIFPVKSRAYSRQSVSLHPRAVISQSCGHSSSALKDQEHCHQRLTFPAGNCPLPGRQSRMNRSSGPRPGVSKPSAPQTD